MAYGIAVDGTITKIRSGYEGLRGFIDGCIDSTRIRSGSTRIWVHDEGLLIGMPLNNLATLIAGQPLVGPAVLHTPHEHDVDCDALKRTSCPVCRGPVDDDGWCVQCDHVALTVISGKGPALVEGARRQAAISKYN